MRERWLTQQILLYLEAGMVQGRRVVLYLFFLWAVKVFYFFWNKLWKQQEQNFYVLVDFSKDIGIFDTAVTLLICF